MFEGGDLLRYVVARVGRISHDLYWHSFKKDLTKSIQRTMNRLGGPRPRSHVPIEEHEIRARKIARLLLDTTPTYRTDRSDAGWLFLKCWLTRRLRQRYRDKQLSCNDFSELIPVSCHELMQILWSRRGGTVALCHKGRHDILVS